MDKWLNNFALETMTGVSPFRSLGF